MVAMTAISFFLIALVVLVLGALGVAVLIAVVTKRPTIAVIAGLVMLFLVAVSIASIWLSVTYSPSPQSALVTPGMNVYPDLQSVDAPSVVQTPQFAPIAGESHMKVRFGFFVVFPFLIAVVLGIFVALASRSNKSAEHRGRWWPAMLLLSLIAAPAFLVVVWRSDRAVGPRGAGHVEMMPQFLPHTNIMLMRQQQSVERERRKARQQRAEAQAEVRRVQQQIAEQFRANSPRPDEAKRVAEHATEKAVNALLRTQFVTMDINQLIEVFQAPKIELAENAEQPLPTESAAAPPPAAAEALAPLDALGDPTAALPSADGIPPIAPKSPASALAEAPSAAVAEDAADEKSSSVAVEAEPGDALLVAAQANAEEGKPLPEWIHDEPGPYKGNSNLWREVIATDEYATPEECRQASDILMLLKTAERVYAFDNRPYFGDSHPSLTFDPGIVMLDNRIVFHTMNQSFCGDDRLRLLQKMGIGIDLVKKSAMRDQRIAARVSPGALGTVYKQYSLMEFNPEFDKELRRAWDNYRRTERFEMVTAGAGSVLGLLGLVFGLLKIDTWTKGYYSKRLFIGVPAAIIGVIFILVVWSEGHF